MELEADLMYHELRRKTYITPKSYLDGIQAAFNFAQSGLAVPGLNLADVKGIGAAFDAGITSRSAGPIIDPQGGLFQGGGLGSFLRRPGSVHSPRPGGGVGTGNTAIPVW